MQRASIARRLDHSVTSDIITPRSRSTERPPSDHHDPSHHNMLLAARLEDGVDLVDLNRERSASSRSAALQNRAMSDPFDAQEFEQDFVDEDHARHANTADILSTFPRFPVEGQRHKNCWSEPPISLFNIRSIEYFTNRKKPKVTSGPYLLKGRGVDLFLIEEGGSPFLSLGDM
jgi:hypothetical protein